MISRNYLLTPIMLEAGGKPKSGPVCDAKRISHANYKLAIKHKRQDNQEMFTNDLHEALMAIRQCIILENLACKVWSSETCKSGRRTNKF